MRRIPELDGLRGLASVLVVGHHLWTGPLWFGWMAVDVFFVLSGYLITAIILKYSGERGFLWAFYARRGLRIWPIYALMIAVALVFTVPEPGAVWYYVAYLQNFPLYWGGHVPVWHEMVHTWTLALEEQFYLLWPALLIAVGPRVARSGAVPLIVAGGAILARAWGMPPNLLPARCDGFALGGLIACWSGECGVRLLRAGWLSFVAALGLLAWVAVSGAVPFDGYTPRNVAAATLLSFAIVALVTQRRSAFGWLGARPLVFLGTISYGLYLYHYPIILRSYSLTIRLGIHRTPFEPWFLAALSFVVATVSWYAIEAPILRLKDRLPYGGSGQTSRRETHTPEAPSACSRSGG